MVGSKAIMKNKPGKAVGKNQSQQLASGIFLMMEQYGCWVTAADHRTSGGRERCHQQIFVLCLQTAQLRRVKNAGTWASSLGLFSFYEPTLPPSSHFGEVHQCPEWSNASGLFYTKCGFTEESTELSVLSSSCSLPLVGATLFAGADLSAQLNGEESSPSHTSGLHLPLQLGRIHKSIFYFG